MGRNPGGYLGGINGRGSMGVSMGAPCRDPRGDDQGGGSGRGVHGEIPEGAVREGYREGSLEGSEGGNPRVGRSMGDLGVHGASLSQASPPAPGAASQQPSGPGGSGTRAEPPREDRAGQGRPRSRRSVPGAGGGHGPARLLPRPARVPLCPGCERRRHRALPAGPRRDGARRAVSAPRGTGHRAGGTPRREPGVMGGTPRRGHPGGDWRCWGTSGGLLEGPRDTPVKIGSDTGHPDRDRW